MSVGIGTVVFLVSLGYGLQYILIGNLITSEDSLMTLEAAYPSEAGKGIDLEKMEEIKTNEEVDAISPVTEFSGELSDVTQKKLCGTERGERLSIANIEFEDVKGINPEEARDIIAYLNDDFSYLGEDYQIHEMIKYLLDLGGLYKDGQLEKENERKHLFLINSMGKHVEEYFGEEYRGRFSINGCWNVIASIEGLSTVYGYGLAPDLLYRSAMITLSDGSAIRIIMLVKGECLPASKTTSLEYF